LLIGISKGDGVVSHIEAHNISYRADPIFRLTGQTIFKLVLRAVDGVFTPDNTYHDCTSAEFSLNDVGAAPRFDNQATNTGSTFVFPMSGSECSVGAGREYAFYFFNVTNGNSVGGTIRVDANNDTQQQATWRGW
jgi:hypothetical protein